MYNTDHALSFLNIKSERFIFLKYPLVIFMHCQQLVSVTLSFYSQLSYFQPRFKLQGGVGWVGSLFRAKLSGKGHFSIWRRVLNSNEKLSLLTKTIAQMTVWVTIRQMRKRRVINRWYSSLQKKNIKLKEPTKNPAKYLYIYFSSKWGEKWEIINKCFPSGRHSLDLRDPFAVSSTGGSTNPQNQPNPPNPPIHQLHPVHQATLRPGYDNKLSNSWQIEREKIIIFIKNGTLIMRYNNISNYQPGPCCLELTLNGRRQTFVLKEKESKRLSTRLLLSFKMLL